MVCPGFLALWRNENIEGTKLRFCLSNRRYAVIKFDKLHRLVKTNADNVQLSIGHISVSTSLNQELKNVVSTSGVAMFGGSTICSTRGITCSNCVVLRDTHSVLNDCKSRYSFCPIASLGTPCCSCKLDADGTSLGARCPISIIVSL